MTRYCLVTDGDTRWYLCPVGLAEQAKDWLGRDYYYWESGGEAPHPGPKPEWLIYIDNPHTITFTDPQ